MNVNEARELIDRWLQETVDRELFSADEVRDHLLDLRVQLVDEPVPA